MDILEKLKLYTMDEAVFKKVIRGGKLQRKLICPPGMKAVGGKCVRMSGSEKIKRSKAAKKTQKKLQADVGKKIKMEKKKAKSLRKRANRIPKDASTKD